MIHSIASLHRLYIVPTLAIRQTTEQAELARRKLELSALRATLIAREHALTDLRAHLLSFEGRYIRQVGKLYAQLDEWEKKIAELDSPLLLLSEEEFNPNEPPHGNLPTNTPDADDPEASLDLKTLFRELARRIHPDFASDAADAEHRNRLMAQANDAFRRRDTDMLQRMLNGHDATDTHTTTAAKLARVRAQSARVEQDIAKIDVEITTLTHSELAKLQQRTLAAAQKGRDLLAEMAARVKGNIGIAMRRYELDLERKKRNQPALDPTSFLSAEAPSPRSKAVASNRPHDR